MRIDEMPAGREMDALIWDKVMGRPFLGLSNEPHYSTSISAAWLVFLKFLDPNRTSLHPCGNGAEGLWWAVYYDDEMVAHAKTSSLAICRAALKAMGVEEC